MKKRITCSVVGARGYTGIETARLLLLHPNAQLENCFATSEFKLSKYLSSPRAVQIKCLLDSELMQNLTDVVFLATPAEVSLKLAPQILSAGKKVIDLSGAFRLKQHEYLTWYGFEHTEKALLKTAQYGLAPFAGPAKTEKLIANPGCYATAIGMALIPLLKNDVIEAENIVIDAKSGATGAGKKASENLLFTEVEGECLPYKVGKHQHLPEITEAIEAFSGKKIDAHFTTSLLGTRRGIIAGIYANVRPGTTLKDIEIAFEQAYESYSLVSFAKMPENTATERSLVSLKNVVGTGKTHISYELIGRKLYVFSCIDNLLKGAASQAIENFNRISDLPLFTGVDQLEACT